MNTVRDVLSAEAVARYLPKGHPFALSVFDELPSTNAFLKEAGAKGAKEGAVCIAAAQTMGRGRLGRSFFSPAGTGLYLSVLLRPALPPERSVRLTAAAAVAAAEALEETAGVTPGIKWVNDLYVNGRKVAGILAESALSSAGEIDYAVLGVGFNLLSPPGGFPPDIEDVAGAVLSRPIEDGRALLAAAFLTRFFFWYGRLAEEIPPFLESYRRRCFFLGEDVDVLRGESAETVRALSVEEDFALSVQRTDGSVQRLTFGEIRLRIRPFR